MQNPLDLTGRHILVTGASSGIGRACAVLMSRLGASIVLVARDRNRLEQTRTLLEGTGHTVVPYNLVDFEHYCDLFGQCTSEKKLSGVVHAAGIGPVMPIQSVSCALMSETMAINYYAFLELVKWFSKKRYSEGGSVVAVSSVSSLAGWMGGALYCGSKGALDASVRALAIELVAKKIRVNSVVPSNIRTPMLEQSLSVGGEQAVEAVLDKQPLGYGDPVDVANAVAFLMSEAARFITGTNLVVDGGYLSQ